jgi:hypothetical protein
MKLTNHLATVMMFSGIFCVASAQTSPGVGGGSSASTEAGYVITLTQPTNGFSLDSPIQVTMTIKNITNRDIFWRASRGTDNDTWYADFRFLLTKDGKEAETTFFHRVISGRQRPNDPVSIWSGSTMLVPKPPGTIFVITVDLKHLYQITEPGQYTLEISRLADDNKTIVHSNTVSLSVKP